MLHCHIVSHRKKIAFPFFLPNHKPQIINIKILGRSFFIHKIWFLFSFAFAKHKFCAFEEKKWKKMLQKMESIEMKARNTNTENQQFGNAVRFWKINEFPRSQIDCQIDIKNNFFIGFYWKCSVTKVQLSFNQRKHGNKYRSAYTDSCIALKFLSRRAESSEERQKFGQNSYWAYVCVLVCATVNEPMKSYNGIEPERRTKRQKHERLLIFNQKSILCWRATAICTVAYGDIVCLLLCMLAALMLLLTMLGM